MTNEQLRAFVAVAEKGSFRAAADSLHKTQPTISAAVKSLEQQFGFHLFSRDSYRPSLTTEGQAFFRQAKQMLLHAHQLEKLGHELAVGMSPSLAVCLSPVCADYAELNRIKDFCDAYPSIRLKITTEHLNGVQEQLELGKADLAISPHYGLNKRQEFVETGQIEMVTVAAAGFGNLDFSQQIKQRELYQFPHILIEDTSSQPFDHVNVLPFGECWYVGDYQMKKALLLGGMGWARIPKHMIGHELDSGELALLEIENFSSRSHMPVYLIRTRRQPLSNLADCFWKHMTAHR